jgi:hypothetical protein
MNGKKAFFLWMTALFYGLGFAAENFPKPYSPPCTERENVFEFTEKPRCRFVGDDKYEITFAVKGNCDVTVGIIDQKGVVVRHVASGVLGANAPAPFQKNALKQTIYWNGKNDLDQYVREPGKLRVRVMLGLKPAFDKLLGDGGPKNLPGYIFGLAVGPDAAYVMYKGNGSHGHVGVRKFDRDGNFLTSLVPPPADLPESKMSGMGYIEYEKGAKTVFGPNLNETLARDAYILPGINGKSVGDCQPALVGDKLYFTNAGDNLLAGKDNGSKVFYLYTDGGTDIRGVKEGRAFLKGGAEHLRPRLTTSHDGKTTYMLGVGHGVLSWPTAGNELAKTFVGETGKPGSDNAHLNNPQGFDCDAQGRLYVSDFANNRIQIFSAEGKHLKTVPCERPTLLRVHQKTGAIYVFHAARIEGKTIGRLSKFESFDKPEVRATADNLLAACFALDHWSPKARLWIAGEKTEVNTGGASGSGPSVRIFEEDGKTFKLLADFDEEAKKVAGSNYIGRFSGADGMGSSGLKLVCDPTREQVLFRNQQLFDLRTGDYLGHVKFPAFRYDDTAYDAYGRLHVHLNPGFDHPGIIRVDPTQAKAETGRDGGKSQFWPEMPYDYGVEIPGKYSDTRKGAIPVRDQPGAKFFQDGLGVNMLGDLAVQTNIYYAPKMSEEGMDLAMSGANEMSARGEYVGGNYADAKRKLEEMMRKGEDVYFVRRRPGIPLVGATVWTFDWTGELRDECAAVVGKHVAGVMMDEDGKIYYVTSRPKMVGERHFLSGQGGTFGLEKDAGNANPFTGTLIKGGPKGVDVVMKQAPIALDPAPQRPPDLMHMSFPNVFGKDGWAWVNNAEWLYAGVSPVQYTGCTCPTSRFGLDWYKRSFVPENYRHSVGVLDGAGNLIMHLGRYGNFDSWHGPKSKIPVGDEGISFFVPRFISATDNYIAVHDWAERIVVLKINYHAEETVPIAIK